ncbi:MAG: ABC transporter permease subunit, partial [candidate division NC10 bacterium]
MTRIQRLTLQGAGIAIVLLAWEAVGRIMGDAFFAPATVVAREYLVLLRDGEMLSELLGSLQQMLVGFGLACVIGMPLGIAMGRSRACDVIFHPWVSMFVVISVAALVPLFILLFGSGFGFRVTIVFMASAWYVVLTTYHGARGVEPRFLDVARSFAASRGALFWKVLMPALYPYLITGARIGLVHAIRAMVVAEMYVIVGYGGLIHKTGLSTSTAPLLGLLITLMVVSMLANTALRVAGRRLAPWYEER